MPNIDLMTTIGDKICFMKILTSYSAFIHCPKLIHFIKNVILLLLKLMSNIMYYE